MPQRIKAVYRGGAFIPKTPYNLPENAEVELIVEDPYLLPPLESDPKKREELLEKLVKDMLENPFPKDAPHFTRDQLHERR